MMTLMEAVPIVIGALLALAAVVVVIVVMARNLRPSLHRAPKHQRGKNQREVEEWIARTKGEDHVRRMRGE